MRSRWVLASFILAAGCFPRPPQVSVEPETIPHHTSHAIATLAAIEGLEDAGLEIDARAPALGTRWRHTAPIGTRLAPSRRVAIRVRVDPGAILVRPVAEECDGNGCVPVASLLPEEALLVRRAVESIRARLEVLEPESVSSIERQVTRDPAPPTGRGPIAIPTRMGPTQVAAGWEVDAVLVNGALVSGRVLGVSADGLTIELSPGRELVLWAGDLASIRVR